MTYILKRCDFFSSPAICETTNIYLLLFTFLKGGQRAAKGGKIMLLKLTSDGFEIHHNGETKLFKELAGALLYVRMHEREVK